ncbi:hypothetical protein PLESTB_000968300 [Pleodorina starrii]|uniref:Uncharacterized protein n=1 Tax=Pleodorina starrii TaxID=330485 RepID=A0A9W6F3L4_9CHLO|nr:hypothetical protein PLESTB_000968300 [Pleodorina starrii]
MYTLAGLWIILGGAVGLALIACAVSMLLRMLDKAAPPEERKLSSIFVSGYSARIARSASRGGGGSLHGGRRNSSMGGGGSLHGGRRNSSMGGGGIALVSSSGSLLQPVAAAVAGDTPMAIIKVRPSPSVVFPEDYYSSNSRQLTAATDISVRPMPAAAAAAVGPSSLLGSPSGGAGSSNDSVRKSTSSSQPALNG